METLNEEGFVIERLEQIIAHLEDSVKQDAQQELKKITQQRKNIIVALY